LSFLISMLSSDACTSRMPVDPDFVSE